MIERFPRYICKIQKESFGLLILSGFFAYFIKVSNFFAVMRLHIFTVHTDLYVISRFQLCIPHVIVFHVHKRSVRICLTVIIPSLETGCTPVINGLTLQKTTDFLKILSPASFRYAERLHVFLIQQGDCILYFQKHLFFPFSNGFLPYTLYKNNK